MLKDVQIHNAKQKALIVKLYNEIYDFTTKSKNQGLVSSYYDGILANGKNNFRAYATTHIIPYFISVGNGSQYIPDTSIDAIKSDLESIKGWVMSQLGIIEPNTDTGGAFFF